MLTLTMSLTVQENKKPYLNFINSLKSKQTKKQYKSALFRFISRNGNATLDGLLSLSPKEIEQIVTKHITEMNARGLSHAYINLVMCAIFHFFDINDILLNKKKIAKFTGENKKMNKDRAYTHDEIKHLADTGDFRFKAIVLLLASTGVRLGSIPSLRMCHLEKKGHIYKVTIYENSKEEYICFTTPEATSAIDQYLEYRSRAMETISPDSPLIRNDFNFDSIEKVRKNSKPIAYQTLKNLIYSRLIKAGLIEKPDLLQKYGKRHPVPLSHGFRKFWMNQAVNAKLNPEIREMLLGHCIGLASSYYRPTEAEIRAEAEKAADLLTIDSTMRLRLKVENLELEKSQFDRLAEQIKALEQKIK
jgi:integrase